MKLARKNVYLAMVWQEEGHKAGIGRCARERNWTIRQWLPKRQEDWARSPDAPGLTQFRPDGIISQLSSRFVQLAQIVQATRVPVVELCHALPEMCVPRVVPDGEAAGATAVAHLHERGFSRLLYLGAATDTCHDGFVNAARAIGLEPMVVDTESSQLGEELASGPLINPMLHDEGFAVRRAWLRRLFTTCAKPVGVFTISPVLAIEIIEACRAARIRVPEQVAVVTQADSPGDVFAAPMPLTVIASSYEEQGYQAALLLDRMMRGEQVAPTTVIKIPPFPLVPRQSTFCYASDNQSVARATTYILRHLHDTELCVKRVCHGTGMSRQTIHRIFTRQFHLSVARYIERRRLEEAKKLLRTTDAPASSIAGQCGFGSFLRFRRALIRQTGACPRAYREKERGKG